MFSRQSKDAPPRQPCCCHSSILLSLISSLSSPSQIALRFDLEVVGGCEQRKAVAWWSASFGDGWGRIWVFWVF
ncbi:hypothetical protein CMV_001994 [Castanea mollissima]|uniref:Uncharacterized protein n=1 Tax=Castanea mollissima TaxID=60419 RepID=A0A8J4VXG8_9ROSI|nr:hypothetical protein CMV_001994 [Castanea mollissima]